MLDQGQDASNRSVDPCNSRQLVSSTTYTGKFEFLTLPALYSETYKTFE